MFQGRILALRFAVTLCAVLHQPHAAGQDLDLPSPSDSLVYDDSYVGSGAEISDVVPLEADNAQGEADTIPLFPESESPSWFVPTSWFAGPIWEKSLELGINGSEGNAQSISVLASGKLKRETERSVLGIDVVYGKSEANSTLTQHYAFLNSRFDLKLGKSRWSLFEITRLEYDEFKAFDWRLAINGGVGYDVIRTDTRKLTGRLGAGTSREFGTLVEEWVPEAVFGADYNHQLSDRQKLSFTSDYYPSWEQFSDYRLVTQASWELLLDEATNLSLKIGLLDRYDSTPLGRKANDVDYFVTLLWKL